VPNHTPNKCMKMIVIGKNKGKFVAYFAGNPQKNYEGDTREEAVGKLILEQGKFNGLIIENE